MPVANQIFHLEVAGIELADGQRHAAETARRDHGRDAAAIGQSRVENRFRFRNVVSKTPGNVLDCDHERSLPEGHARDLLKEALFFDENPVGAVHHDFADRVVENQVLDGFQETAESFRIRSSERSFRELHEVRLVRIVVIGLEVTEHRAARG